MRIKKWILLFAKIIHEQPGGGPRVHVHVLHTPLALNGDDARLRFYRVEGGIDALKRQ